MLTAQGLRPLVNQFRLMCFAVLFLGVWISLKTHDPHWVERSGKLIVACSLILTFVQFRYELSHASAENVAGRVAAAVAEERGVAGTARDALPLRSREEARYRVDEARAYLLQNALVSAALGEMVSAFGGLIMELFL
jgi:hypothetical protein